MLRTVDLMGEELTCLKQGPVVTSHGVQPKWQTEYERQGCSGCRGRVPVEGGNGVTLAHGLPGKPVGLAPHALFD